MQSYAQRGSAIHLTFRHVRYGRKPPILFEAFTLSNRAGYRGRRWHILGYMLSVGAIGGLTVLVAAGASGGAGWPSLGYWLLRLVLTALIVVVFAVN